jgi:hypothetical protein
MTLYYIVRDGRDRGTKLKPHRYPDGKFRMRRKAGEPWIPVEEGQIESYLEKGYILRMSAKGHSASGICGKSIQGRG